MPGPERFFLGVDGGQSSTRAVVADDSGTVLGRATAGPCNALTSDETRAAARETAQELVQDVLANAGLPEGTKFASACFGMSGNSPAMDEIVHNLAACPMVELLTDARVALEGATAGGPGVIVAAGTGSIAMARDAGGNLARYGGWGHVFGDEGSAFDIVRHALRRALALEVTRTRFTALRQIFLSETNSRLVHEALHRFYDRDWPGTRIAALAPKVDLLAEQGDECAREILTDAGNALASLALSAKQSLLEGGRDLLVYTSGGVFNSRLVRDSFAARLRSEGHEIGRSKHDPAIGALLLAYRSVNIDIAVKET